MTRAPRSRIRKTLRAWRSTSSAPMYTSHSSPRSAAAVSVATPCWPRDEPAPESPGAAPGGGGGGSRVPLPRGADPPHLVRILAPGLGLDAGVDVDGVRARGGDGTADVLGREAGREDDPPLLAAQLARDRPLDRLAGLALAPACGAVEQERGRARAVGQKGHGRRPRRAPPPRPPRRRRACRLYHPGRVGTQILGPPLTPELERPGA